MGRDLLLVGAGGFIGAALRYGLSLSLARFAFPMGTLLVNVIGSFALGWLYAKAGQGEVDGSTRHFLGVGLLGAFTTFSTFSVETLALVEEGALGRAAMSVILNVGLGLWAAALGLVLGTR